MFKSERRPRQYQSRDRDRDRDNSRNDFRGFKEKKKVEIELKAEDFPELVAVENAGECKLNFKEASTKETNDDIEGGEILPYGWVSFMKKDGDVVMYANLPREYEESFHDEAVDVFDEMINRWEDYRDDYDDLHGDGAYDRVYKMPNYESNFDDSDEYDEY